MNERLTELYRASRPKEALASQDEFKSANALLGSDVEKFAKLIVAECIDVVLNSDPSPKMIAHEPYRTIMNNIQEHFGVEE